MTNPLVTPDVETLAKGLCDPLMHDAPGEITPHPCRSCEIRAARAIALGAVVTLDAALERFMPVLLALAKAAKALSAAPSHRGGGGWPFGTESACRLIAATGNPNERVENRDAWAVTMLHRPDVLAIEIDRARERLEQAIAYVQTSATPPEVGPP